VVIAGALGCAPLDEKPELSSTSQGITCQATYECPGGYHCTQGTCVWDNDLSCQSNCDCPNFTSCFNGRCELDFGPFPECHCTSHCAAGEVCIGRGCEPDTGGGGGGGGPIEQW
jgi:hypothetical protein